MKKIQSLNTSTQLVLSSIIAILFIIAAIVVLKNTGIDIISVHHLDGVPYDTVAEKMPGVRCPRCAENGLETFVLSGKRCPICNHQC